MKSAENWLSEYATTHRNPSNKRIHQFCVPAIFWSTLAILWACPTPTVIAPIPWLNWAMIASVPALLFYLSLGIKYFVGIALFIGATFYCCYELELLGYRLGLIAIVIFVIAWLGQFYGHRIEGKKPSFFTDLVFLLIGPLWVIELFFPSDE
jgi:uncharacterized membrane protein YGL010W